MPVEHLFALFRKFAKAKKEVNDLMSACAHQLMTEYYNLGHFDRLVKQTILDQSGADLQKINVISEEQWPKYIFTDDEIEQITTDLLYSVGWTEDDVLSCWGRVLNLNNDSDFSILNQYTPQCERPGGLPRLMQWLEDIQNIRAPVPFSENKGYYKPQAYTTQSQFIPIAKPPLYQNLGPNLQFSNNDNEEEPIPSSQNVPLNSPDQDFVNERVGFDITEDFGINQEEEQEKAEEIERHTNSVATLAANLMDALHFK